MIIVIANNFLEVIVIVIDNKKLLLGWQSAYFFYVFKEQIPRGSSKVILSIDYLRKILFTVSVR